MVNKLEQMSAERKTLQEKGEVPSWYTTSGYVMFMDKYVSPGKTLKDRYQEIADSAGNLAAEMYGEECGEGSWSQRFFDVMWRGWLSPSTPVLINMGTDRGTPVSCSGGCVTDSIDGFYTARHETAILTKNGFGTSAYLGAIRPRGSGISVGGSALGVMPVLKGFVQDMNDVSQGSHRRGAWAGYLPVEHGDFNEVADYLLSQPDQLNFGWLISDEFLEKLNSGDKDAIAKYQKILKIRKTNGKGYMVFIDKMNRLAPKEFAENGLTIKASNLCSEVALPSDSEHSYTCVLSSLNAAHYDDWKATDLIFVATVFLDCVAESFIRIARGKRGLTNTVRFTQKARALGLGLMGFHTYVQKQRWAWDDLKTAYFNQELFELMRDESLKASEYMASVAGSPEWCKGSGRRNLTLLAVAPNMSTALICGGVSQGIEPVVANVWNQGSQSGEMERINPVLLDIMKERGVYTPSTIQEIINDNGSVGQVSWLSDQEKRVFRTAFEIDQEVILRLASQRQKFIDQGQSLNLFFAADADPKYLSKIHRMAAEDPYIKALYYCRSQAGVRASTGEECVACEQVMIYYVSGAINGLPVDSVETDFKRGIRSVKDLGFYALSPLDIPKCEKAQYHSWECCLRYDLVEMLKCDGLYMLVVGSNPKVLNQSISLRYRLV